jgi:MIP family channel proteins
VAFVAEYIAMTLFVIIGCGNAMGIAGTDGWILQVSLTFGWAITALAYSIGFYSGGHINCAVTLGLVLTKNCSVQQGLANFIAQMFGSLSGASVLCMMYDKDADKTGGLGSNGVGKDVKWYNALVGEIMMTFLLVFVVLKTAIHPGSMGNRSQACLAIGFAVFLAHSVLIPLDGCSINPTRSLGPAIIAQIRYEDSKSFDDMWIFLCGPLLGAALAAGAYELMKRVGEIEENPETDIILAVQLGHAPPVSSVRAVRPVVLPAVRIREARSGGVRGKTQAFEHMVLTIQAHKNTHLRIKTRKNTSATIEALKRTNARSMRPK